MVNLKKGGKWRKIENKWAILLGGKLSKYTKKNGKPDKKKMRKINKNENFFLEKLGKDA